MAALASALCWALSAILFRQVSEKLPATGMNWWKGLIALLFLSVLLLPELPAFSYSESYMRLAASGLLGILIGDTLYFMALSRLGPRITLLMGTLIPVVTALIAVSLFGDQMSALAWAGLLLTISGVAWVLWARSHEVKQSGTAWPQGLIFAIGFVIANAIAIILTKQGVEEMDAAQATWIRTLWAVMALTFYAAVSAHFTVWMVPLKSKMVRRRLFLAAIIGALLGTWLSIAALKYTLASVAAVLNSTSPIFILPLMYMFYKEKPDVAAVLGAIAAVGGVGIYFISVFS